jgi:pyridoxal phosphate-dependent aminotransferase EpsN
LGYLEGIIFLRAGQPLVDGHDPGSAGLSSSTMDIIQALEAENIESRPVWKLMHLQPLFAGCRYFTHGEEESVSGRLFQQGVCLPSGTSLTEEEQERVIRCVRGLFL